MSSRRVVAIHQPNFFPWLSYFDKIIRCDVFVILDNVQFQKKGGTWSNRVRILAGNKADWITAPLNRAYHGVKKISEIETDNSKPWREKIIKTIETNYGSAPYFGEVFPVLNELVRNHSDNLSEYNLNSIRTLCEILEIDTSKFERASELSVNGTATDLLINIVKETGATGYLYGRGAVNYQDNDKFNNEGLELIAQDFIHPVYSQFSSDEFIPGLSVIDSLMNVGIASGRKLLTIE